MKQESFANAANISERLINKKSSNYKNTSPQIDWWIKSFFAGNRKSFNNYIGLYGISSSDITSIPAHAFRYSFSFSQTENQKQSSPDHKSEFVPHIEYLKQKNVINGHEWLCNEFITSAFREVRVALDSAPANSAIFNKQALMADFLLYLSGRLAQLTLPIIVLEANITRLNLTNSSQSSEERFKEFAQSLSERDAQEKMWGKYPVLWRNLSVVTSECKYACIETIRNIAADIGVLRKFFDIQDREKVENILWEVGDPHCQGRAVSILDFGQKKIVYKPKSLKVDAVYTNFIKWYSSCSPELPLQACEIVDCGDHGYATYISARTCTSEVELSRFYEKVGALLCIFWLLGGNDLHHENLIASGSEPYPIDLETLFDKQLNYSKGTGYQKVFLQCHRDLLFKTYILPVRVLGPDGVSDISAIGAIGLQVADAKVFQIVNYARDDARFVLKSGTIEKEQNTPSFLGVTAKPRDFTDQVLRGYNTALSVIIKHKPFLLSKESPLELFRGAQVRWIGRKTQDYVDILRSTAHPTVLKDALECDMLMGGRLYNIDRGHHLNHLIKSEVRDLWQRDIPYFWTTPDSDSLFDSNGTEISNFFAESGFAALRKRLAKIEDYRCVHREVILDTLKTTSIDDPVFNNIYLQTKISDRKTSQNELVTLSSDIGDRIISAVHYVDGIPFWSGISSLNSVDYTAGLLAPTLYEGAPGIGLFFGFLYQYSKDAKHLKAAEGTHNLVRLLLRTSEGVGSCGAFDGFAGLIYCDMLLSALLGRTLSTNDRSLRYFTKLIRKDTKLDIISGAAGALIVSLRYFKLTGNDLALEAARAAAVKLEEAMVENDRGGAAWPTNISNFDQPLGGLGHGVSGIAWALSEWGRHTNDQRWLKISEKAIAYEESLFDPKLEAWKDVRKENATSSAWCHGAPGIGLAISRVYESIDVKRRNSIIRRAQKCTLASGYDSHCLCHGAFGNAEFYREVKDTNNTDLFVEHAIATYKKEGFWRCGFPQGFSVPGLMCGLAGIGYGLLRHLDSKKVPNLLLLDIPSSSS